MENFCTICCTTHESPKWYNSKDNHGLICKKAYLKQYYEDNKESINEDRKKRYQEDENYKNKINEKNKENDKKRRASGYTRIKRCFSKS